MNAERRGNIASASSYGNRKGRKGAQLRESGRHPIRGNKKIEPAAARPGRSRIQAHKPSSRFISPRSIQIFLRGRILMQKRRRSLESVNPEACSATQEFFDAKKVDVLYEVSDMEKPSHDRRADDEISLRELAGVLSTLYSGAIERGLFQGAIETGSN